MLTKVISGGQIGADIAGLRAAKRCVIKTGGMMPKDFKTLVGPKPEWAQEFNLLESEYIDYPSRTRANVRDSDGTVRIAYNFGTPGEKCTLRATDKFKKPRFDVSLHLDLNQQMNNLGLWIAINQISVLNVAGNARIDIEPIIEDFLVSVFSAVNGLTNG